MKISIIGGSGFVGSRLISFLKAKNVEIQNIDKAPSKDYPELTEIADVRDVSRLTVLLKGTDVVVLLAAEHRDDVTPASLYYDVNVGGMRNTLLAMEANGISHLLFTSSVAVYGLNKENPSEEHPIAPFNDYGHTKWEAECVLRAWYQTHPKSTINILRPTVIFGEGNRGNVYNLLRQISSGKFFMIGKGNNSKSMAYVGNIVAFIVFLIEKGGDGYNVYNYVDKPDFTMNDLVYHVGDVLGKHIPTIHLPYWLGMLAGYGFDLLGKLSGKKMTVSSVRVKKFCATTQFDACKVQHTGFKPEYRLEEGLTRTLKYEFSTSYKSVSI